MHYVNIKEIGTKDLNVRNVEIFPETWSRRKEFNRYHSVPRPTAALFFICTDISVTFYPQDGKAVTGNKGDVIYLPKNARYYVTVSGTQNRVDTYTINFVLEETEEVLLHPTITKLTTCHDSRFTVAAEQLYRATYHFERSGQQNLVKIKSEFFSLLDLVSEVASTNENVYYPIRIGVHALQAEWNQNKKIEEYAAMCGISIAYFYRCFKEWCGQSPVEYRNQLRLHHA
ncbi:MAG: helix-turn-helix transcriptional regulator, partial [Clostridia bacterium]|nr:helix-turn-helix transcriptional regulator [Clostridia bacterium]